MEFPIQEPRQSNKEYLSKNSGHRTVRRMGGEESPMEAHYSKLIRNSDALVKLDWWVAMAPSRNSFGALWRS